MSVRSIRGGVTQPLVTHSEPPHLRPIEPGLWKAYRIGCLESSDHLHEGKPNLHFGEYPHRVAINLYVMHPLAQRNCNPIIVRCVLFVKEVKCTANEQHGGHDASDGRDAAARLRTSLASHPVEVLILKPTGSAVTDCRRRHARTSSSQCIVQTRLCAQRCASSPLQSGPKWRAAHVSSPEFPPRHAVVLPVTSHW
eukprot:5020663-Prymnesium_polylepis.1